MKFANKAFLTAICTSALFGLAACSSDSSTHSSNGEVPNPDQPTQIELPTSTLISPILFSTMSATPNGNQTIFKINGDAHFNLEDTLALTKDSEPAFTKIKFTITKIVNGATMSTTATIAPDSVVYPDITGSFPDKINFSELNLTASNITECGTYRIYATAYASDDITNYNKFITKDSVQFTRDEILCAVNNNPASSSSTPEQSIILKKTIIPVNTANGEGLSLTTLAPVPTATADISIIVTEVTNEIKLVAKNGFQIAAYSNNADKNYTDDWNSFELPPEPAKMSDFRFKENALGTTIAPFDEGLSYVAIAPNYNKETGDGFYALINQGSTIPDPNRNITLTFIVYSK